MNNLTINEQFFNRYLKLPEGRWPQKMPLNFGDVGDGLDLTSLGESHGNWQLDAESLRSMPQ